MSTEIETSTTIQPTPANTENVSQTKKITKKCNTCCSITEIDDETFIPCLNKSCQNITCHACLTQMVQQIIYEPNLNYPLKCPSCERKMDDIVIDKILAEHDEYEKCLSSLFTSFWSVNCIQTDEELVQCPFCSYFEIHTTDACPISFLACQSPSCLKKSCLLCLHEVVDDEEEARHRTECLSILNCKRMIDKAIEIGSTQKCPHCGLKGIKDDNCTHMTCERCKEMWCYLCGMKEEECVVDDYDDQTLSSHNSEWHLHKGRCPMYLISINEFDDRWPHSDIECLEYFHRFKTLKQLKIVMDIIGEDELESINDRFQLINATGYSIDEIKSIADEVLIKYSDGDGDD